MSSTLKIDDSIPIKTLHNTFCSVRTVLLLCLTGLILIFGHISSNTGLLVPNAVPLFTENLGHIQHTQVETNTSQKCTFALFRKYNAQKQYFPHEGTWQTCAQGQTKVSCYQPKICKYQYPRVTVNYIQQCLAAANLSSIVTIGDSTAARNFIALKGYLGPCKQLSAERNIGGGFIPDLNYLNRYSGDLKKFLKVHFKFCSGCTGSQWECHRPNNQTNRTVKLRAEHIGMNMIFDDAVQFQAPSYAEGGKRLREMWAITTQEFYLRYFLKNRYPDILLIFLPFHHAKDMLLDRLRVELDYFRQMVDYYVPSTTKVFYIPTAAEDEKTRPRKAKYFMNKIFEGKLASDHINDMNHVLFSVFKDDLLNTTRRTYSFLDLVDVSQSRGDWFLDGVHLKPIWYQSSMSMFWETFCNSVYNDAF